MNGPTQLERLLFVFISLSFTSLALSQQSNSREKFFEITGGLGVSVDADPSMVNYINSIALLSPDQQLREFTSAPEFFITPEVQVSEDWSIALEYSYLLKSYGSVGASQWNFSYSAQMPSLLVHYLSAGNGYCLKFGGGFGYAFGSFNEQYPVTGSEISALASGPLMKLEMVGNTEFDEHFWGSIGIDLRLVFAGTLKKSSVSTIPSPKLNFFSAGLKFGVTYQI